MKYHKKVLLVFCVSALILTGCSSAEKDEKFDNSETKSMMNKDADVPMDESMGPPPGGFGNMSETSKVAVTEGDWSFDVVTETTGDEKTVTSTITYYAGKTDSTVIVPAVLGGAPVTKIASQAFGHHGEITAVYVPSTVTEIADWAFYDLNTALIISFANPTINIDSSAFQSSGNAQVFMPSSTTQTEAGGKQVISDNTKLIFINVENSEAAAIAGGTYLNVTDPNGYEIDENEILNISKGTDSFEIDGATVKFTGEKYVAAEQKIEIFSEFQNDVDEGELNKTFRSLTRDQAEELNKSIEKDSSYKAVKSILNFEAGYYINGNKVELDSKAAAYDVKTGEKIEADAQTKLFPSTGLGQYKYVAYRDNDNDGDIDALYYSPFSLKYSYNSVKISSDNENLNDLNARDIMNPVYLSFANAVVEASGEDTKLKKDLVDVDTSIDGNKIDASSNEERSILWASDYATIDVDEIHAKSSSVGDWAKMSYESDLDAYNVEIIMEWGMNALLYATNGGVVTAGDLGGNKSTFYANGDGANGIIAGGSGTKAGQLDAPSDTSSVYLYNSDLTLEGWNNHIADVVYGGYAYLETINSSTGKEGSYSIGQASALANDFGNGVVDVKDFHTVTYGNRSAGAYVIGGGVITAEDSSFVSKMDAGLVSASGGTFIVKNTSVEGLMGLRNRGGINTDSSSTFTGVDFKVDKDYESYTTGEKASQAVAAWKEANSGSSDLIHFMMSDTNMTIGTLCKNYDISQEKQQILLDKLSSIAGETYTKDTLIRNSVLDNTYYNYSAGAYTGTTDFSDVPYMTVGSSFGGLISSVMEFESAGITVDVSSCTFENNNGSDYNYLIASEAGSAPIVNFNNSDSEGIIWNEGDVQRVVEGRPGERKSKLTVSFNNSDFRGSFADGSNGLWQVDGLEYSNGEGDASSLNGNYYNASANWGTTAEFKGDSTWTVTHDSYLGTLTLEDNSTLTAPEGYSLKILVNDEEKEIKAGTYSGKVIIKLVKK